MSSSNGFLPSLVIDRHGCHRVQALILCSILLALAALGYGGLPGWALATAVVLVIGHGLRELCRASPRAGRYVGRVHVTPSGRFLLGLALDPDGAVPATLVHSWILPGIAAGLAFAGDGGQPAEVILFHDRVPRDTWRRLLVRLRHAAAAGG